MHDLDKMGILFPKLSSHIRLDIAWTYAAEESVPASPNH